MTVQQGSGGAQPLTIVQAVEALAAAAASRGITLTHKSVAKLLYLADLHAAENREAPFTGIDWRWGDYGPWTNRFYRAFSLLVTLGVVTQVDTTNHFGTPEHRIVATSAANASAAGTHIAHIESVLDRYGHMTPNQLGDETYRSAPMVLAQAGGSRGVKLDLYAGVRDRVSWIKLAESMGEDPGLLDRIENEPRLDGPAPDGELLRPKRALYRSA